MVLTDTYELVTTDFFTFMKGQQVYTGDTYTPLQIISREIYLT